ARPQRESPPVMDDGGEPPAPVPRPAGGRRAAHGPRRAPFPPPPRLVAPCRPAPPNARPDATLASVSGHRQIVNSALRTAPPSPPEPRRNPHERPPDRAGGLRGPRSVFPCRQPPAGAQSRTPAAVVASAVGPGE